MQVFVFDLNNISDATLLRAKQTLSASESQRLTHMISLKRQKEFVLGHFLLRQQLSQILKKPAEEICIEVLPSGALFLPNFANIFVSLSHSFNLIAIAICNAPIGVDIQKMNVRMDFKELLNQIDALESAQELIAQGVTLQEAFYHLWTKKEALYKLKSQSLTKSPIFHYHIYKDFMLCTASGSHSQPEWVVCPVADT